LDDFVGRGTTANYYLKPYKDEMAQFQQVYLLSLVGLKTGKQLLRRFYPDLKIQFWQEPWSLMDPANPIFTDRERQDLSAFLEKYGRKLQNAAKAQRDPNISPLGYGESGALVTFFYNTPNNTPLIFWSRAQGWKPLFPRYTGPSLMFAGYYTRVVV
jgi:hypothetical protein